MASGLPDGFFSDQKFQFDYILEDLGMENVVTPPIFWALVIFYIVPLCILYGHFVIL
jgi:hypothetical protein